MGCTLERGRRADHVALLAAMPVLYRVPRNTGEPSPELAQVLKLCEALPGLEKSFLGEFLASFHAAGRAVGNRADERLVPADEHAERLRVAAEARPKQLNLVLWPSEHGGVPVKSWSERQSFLP